MSRSIVSLKSLIPPTKRSIINPHYARIAEDAIAMCQQLGIWQASIHQYNSMSAYLFPNASPEQLMTITLFNNFLYYIDDTFDRHDQTKKADKAQFKLFISALTSETTASDDPMVQAIITIHERLAKQAPNVMWLKRFEDGVIAHLHGSTQDIQRHAGQTWYEAYNDLRVLDSGMTPTMDLIEFVSGSLEESVLVMPAIQETRAIVTYYCSISNDLISFNKEVNAFDSHFNAISMLERDGLSFQDAVNFIISELNHKLIRFKEIRHALYEERNQEIDHYMNALWYQMIAAYHWQLSTNRYRSKQSLFRELQEPL